MGWGYWKPYVSVAQRRAQAQMAVAKARKAGKDMQPVIIEGRTIAKTFWGKAWCHNLEAYSDYESRLPRGRAYVRNGAVVDLVIEPGKVRAQVMGSRLYRVEIAITALPQPHWQKLAQECAGSISSLVELLQGKLSKGVMEHLCAPNTGLFPAPKDIQLACSCPDWATMCKHVAAVLYGVGTRLDTQPELLFLLRQVDAGELVSQAAELPAATRKKPAPDKVLDEAQLAEVFGIELASVEAVPTPRKKASSGRGHTSETPSRTTRTKTTARATTTAGKKAVTTQSAAAAAKKAPARSGKTPSTNTQAKKPAGQRRTAKQEPAGQPDRRKRKKTGT